MRCATVYEPEIEFDADDLPKRNPVYCVAVGKVLDLDAPDLGVPEVPNLWQRLREDKRKVPERGLYCPTCIKTRPSDPEWMYVYERQDGLKIAAHHNPNHKSHANESDEHLALKERIARAAEEGGFRADLEARTPDGKARSDVRVIGANGQMVGYEPQLRYASPQAIRRRDRIRRERGIFPNWHVVDAYHPLIDNVAWSRTDQLPAHTIRDSRDLLVRGGIYKLVLEKCDKGNPAPCPVQATGRCGQYHPTWAIDPRQLDLLVRDIASGEYVSVVQKFGRFTRWFWTSAGEREKYLDAGGELLEPDVAIRERLPRQGSQVLTQRDVECTRDRRKAFQPGEKMPPRDAGATFRPAITLSSTKATGRRPEQASDLSGGERMQLAAELGCSPIDIGPCGRCGAPIIRYGDKARGTLCTTCRN